MSRTPALASHAPEVRSCLNPDGDLRHASSFQNEQGFAEGSPQYSAALKLHITAAADAEKKEKVKESKENLLSIIQAEFPQYIEFLSSSSTEGKESIVTQAAQRHSRSSVVWRSSRVRRLGRRRSQEFPSPG